MAPINRSLPWQRDSVAYALELDPILRHFRDAGDTEACRMVIRAARMAAKAHRPQRRKSGESYIRHPVAVALIAAEQAYEPEMISAALLHDAVEDTPMTLDDLRASFPESVATIVDGVTKLDSVQFETKAEHQAATQRKLFISLAKDWRVLVIKLADRLHNMRTLAAMPPEKQARIARETQSVYAPLAHRFGMDKIRLELEDLAFAAEDPGRYAQVDKLINSRADERTMFLDQIVGQVREGLATLSFEVVVTGREKSHWSIHNKLKARSQDIGAVQDVLGIRILVPTTRDCYEVFGRCHQLWLPVAGRIKDYIAMPKFNNYRALHTTVLGPYSQPIEIQIRTTDMEHVAQRGLAAHWRYKIDSSADEVHELAESADDALSGAIAHLDADGLGAVEFMENVIDDLLNDEVIVFTPAGELVTLPEHSTALDFAYNIHTDIGNRCERATIDGKPVPLNTVLVPGVTVEAKICDDPARGPDRDWLDFVVTARARTAIRLWLSKQEEMGDPEPDAASTGRHLLALRLSESRLPDIDLEKSMLLDDVAVEFGFVDAKSLITAIGESTVSADSVVEALGVALRLETAPEETESDGDSDGELVSTDGASGVELEGHDHGLVRLARCCSPIPGDQIMGFQTRGRGVSVHRNDCTNAISLAKAQVRRLIEASWVRSHVADYTASIYIEAYDRKRLILQVAQVMADYEIDISRMNVDISPERMAILQLDFVIEDPSLLRSVTGKLRGLDGVYLVDRSQR